MSITVAQIHGKDHAFFKDNGGWASPPLVLINSLASLDLCSQERHICLILLNHRYSLSMALMDMGELAQEFGKGIRQMRRWIAKLRAKELIKVTPRAGRPSIIDVSPLVIAVKKLVGWQDAEQPTVVETLAEVVAEPEPTEEELFWLQAADSEEDAAEEKDDLAAEIWEDVKQELKGYMPRVLINNYLKETEGVGWKDMVLLVEVKNHDHLEKMERYKVQANLLLLDRWNNVEGVEFQVRKKPAKLSALAALAVATVGV